MEEGRREGMHVVGHGVGYWLSEVVYIHRGQISPRRAAIPLHPSCSKHDPEDVPVEEEKGEVRKHVVAPVGPGDLRAEGRGDRRQEVDFDDHPFGLKRKAARHC